MNKTFNLEQSKSFCMIPWVHIHTTPSGVAAPCCIAESCATDTGVGDSRTQSLTEIINSDKMNKLRLDMLSDVKNPECVKCHKHEEQGVASFRQFSNKDFEKHYDTVITDTNEDGSLSDFKMRYFDIRFSNICNFKCRTCGPGFSSQWEQEDLKNNGFHAKIVPKNNNKEFLNQVVEQIDHLETAYFAGGEPLITEEHYILLEEMIRKDRTDIKLRYNTNLSNLKFKDKDLVSLWEKFDNRVEVYASIDHYGERAEYIRHGTDWGVVETNFLAAKKSKNVSVYINTVLSVFNFLTIHEFYQYLYDKKMYSKKDMTYSIYNMSTPEFLTCHVLPMEQKEQGKLSLENTLSFMKSKKFKPQQIAQIENAIPWAMSDNTWERHKHEFRNEIKRIDKIRGEDFRKVFPELAILLEPDYKKLWPV